MTPPDTVEPDPHELCNYGSVGVLNTRPDGLQCHVCGDWWTSLAAHAQQTHDLSADEYRAASGLMKKTKLVAPALRKAQSERAAEHLRRIGGPRREAVKNLTIEIQVTIDRYGHLMDGLDERTADRLDWMANGAPLGLVRTKSGPNRAGNPARDLSNTTETPAEAGVSGLQPRPGSNWRYRLERPAS